MRSISVLVALVVVALVVVALVVVALVVVAATAACTLPDRWRGEPRFRTYQPCPPSQAR